MCGDVGHRGDKRVKGDKGDQEAGASWRCGGMCDIFMPSSLSLYGIVATHAVFKNVNSPNKGGRLLFLAEYPGVVQSQRTLAIPHHSDAGSQV